MLNIALAGGMGAGKTTLADCLVALQGYQRLSFADPIRYLARSILGREVEKQRDRELLQRIGGAARATDWRRIDTPYQPARDAALADLAVYLLGSASEASCRILHRALYEEGYAYGWGREDYWIHRYEREYRRATRPVVVDDVRFPVEGRFLGSRGFFVARLEVPLAERQRRVLARDGRWEEAWSQDPTEAQAHAVPAHQLLDGLKAPEQLVAELLAAANAWQAAKGG